MNPPLEAHPGRQPAPQAAQQAGQPSDRRLAQLPDATTLVHWHDAALDASDLLAQAPPGAIWHWIGVNHLSNRLLWDEEDRARRTSVPAYEIAASKRLIDRYNQQRNDAVERVDEAILALLPAQALEDARLSSETAGAMIDRLSILALKLQHMRHESQRSEAGAAHVQACRDKLARLHSQRLDLAACLDRLLREAMQGQAYFKVYRQFKMYNDPALNPYLYGAAQ